MHPMPDFRTEDQYTASGTYVIGIDEVGRGSLAGPVMVGAVCFPLPPDRASDLLALGINDSKLKTATARQLLVPRIRERAMAWSIASSDSECIDRYGITDAFEDAAFQAVTAVSRMLPRHTPWVVLTDTLTVKRFRQTGISQHAVLHGDRNSITIAAASILAKVERDEYMTTLHQEFSAYNWIKNKGYGTSDHREALRLYGPTPHHRKLFIRNVLLERSAVGKWQK
ncbi:MAG: ribonuclease HII [Patescibacteria group bacterium]|nr:ribonuclease HII [Patescibacteria group bacterium]